VITVLLRLCCALIVKVEEGDAPMLHDAATISFLGTSPFLLTRQVGALFGV
jgi:hypothetical protein